MEKEKKSEKKSAIIVVGFPGSGKTTVTKALAKRYGLRYIDGGDALKAIAVRHGYEPGGKDWWETEPGMRFLAERKGNPDFDKEVDEWLLEQVEKGGVAITSRTLPYIGAKGICIWLNVSQETRAKRIAMRDKIPFEQALQAVKDRDEREVELYKKLYGFVLGDVRPFDIVMNTGGLNARETIAKLSKVLESKFGLKPAKSKKKQEKQQEKA